MSRRNLLTCIGAAFGFYGTAAADEMPHSPGSYLIIRRVELFPGRDSGTVKIVAYMNFTQFDVTAGRPQKAANLDRDLIVRIPAADSYALRFELFITDPKANVVMNAKTMKVMPGPPMHLVNDIESSHLETRVEASPVQRISSFGSQAVEHVRDRSKGVYRLYQIEDGTRGAGVSAEIEYEVVKLER